MIDNIKNDFYETIIDIFNALGNPIDCSQITIIDRHVPHTPCSLPKGKMGIYSFYYNGDFLKIGKVGPKSNARFLSQHYNPNSSKSNLARSILNDNKMAKLNLTEQNISEWIKNNCQRVDIILDESLGIFTLELIEAVLHYKYKPLYEGFSSQKNKKS